MFKFRLAKVLRLREHKEKLCLEAVGKSIINLRIAQQEKEKLLTAIGQLEKEYRDTLAGVVLAEKVDLYKNFLGKQYELLIRQDEIIAEKERDLAIARLKLAKAIKERKIMVKLAEKQYWRYHQEEERKEQIFQDELAIISQKRQSE